MAFVTAYGPKVKVGFQSNKPSRTKQSMAAECDIKFIMAQYHRTGLVTHVAKHKGSYGEFEPVDFHDAMTVVKRAEEMFEELPALVRKRFQNDPGEFLDFCNDPANREEMRGLGLLLPEAAVVDQASSEAPSSEAGAA